MDLWSIGIILYYLIRGRLPFNGKNQSDIIETTLKHNITYQDNIWQTVTDQGKDLIQSLLRKDPKERITVEEALQHPWFNKSFNVGSCHVDESLKYDVNTTNKENKEKNTITTSQMNDTDIATLQTLDELDELM